MYRRCLAPSVTGPRRLLVSPVHAGRSSGGSATYSERPRGGRDGPQAGRGSQSRDDRRDDRRGDRFGNRRDERRDERRGGWREDERGERRGGWRDERRDDRRDERRDDRGRSEEADGGRWGDRRREGDGDGGSGGNEHDTAGRRSGSYRPGPSDESRGPRDRERGRGEGGGYGAGRRERGDEDEWRRNPVRASGGFRGEQQQERRYAGNNVENRVDDEAFDDGGEYDDVDDEEEAGPAGRRTSASGASGPCLRDTLQGEALYGVFPVLAALRAKRRKVHRAFVLASLDLSKRKDASLIRQVEALCSEAGVEVVRTVRHELNLMSRDRPHQGLVLDVSPLEWASMDEFPSAEQLMRQAAEGGGHPPVWLALDEVVDPQNLGAVVRSAFCLGAAGVLACSRNCAPLSAVVSKASAGALEALQLHSCHNLPRTLLDARDNKGWAVLGAAAGSGSEPVGQIRVDRPTILVLGSEGFGLRTNVRRACSGLVRVDMAPVARGGPSNPSSSGAAAAVDVDVVDASLRRQQQVAVLRGLVDSLNVSVATGILLHSLINSAAAAATPSAPSTAAEAAAGSGLAAAGAEV